MCGIFGVYSQNELSVDDHEIIKKSKNYLHHRGPDQFNILNVNNKLSLAHTRLSIIDLSKDNYQPRTEDGHTICFNGEIYNFKDLKKKYFINEKFSTQGDTEVLLKMWKKFGINTLTYLDGMYSIAVWDEKKLYLATDPFGEKPLFICELNDKVFFSSEPQIFYDLIKLKKKLKETPFFDFFGVQINEESFFDEVKKISHGTIIEINDGKIVSNKKYIKKKSFLKKQNPINQLSNQNFEEIMDLLINSIKKRLISDQKISLLQSGGYDSTLLLAIIKNEIKLDFQCYHLEQNGMSEKNQILNNFRKLQIDTRNIKFVKFDYNTLNIKEIVKYHNQLTDNFSITLIDSICQKISKDNIRVALSGTGGDELFYGYTKYYNAYKLQKRTKYFDNFFIALFLKLFPKHNILKLINSDSLELISYLKNEKNYKFIKKKINLDQKISKYFSNENLFEDMRDFDLNFTLPENINFNQDIASMKNSVEIRCPFLNNEIFDYVERINPELLFLNGPKTLSKLLLHKYFKLEILKQGFTFTNEIMKKFINTNSTIIDKYRLNNYFDYNFQLGFKQLYKKCLVDKFQSL